MSQKHITNKMGAPLGWRPSVDTAGNENLWNLRSPSDMDVQEIVIAHYKTNAGEKHKTPEDVLEERGYNTKTMAQIGRGSFGIVYKLRRYDSKTEWYAMKTTEVPRRRTGEESMSYVKNELVVMRDARHPNIIQLMESFRINDRIYIVMELADGRTLSDYVRKDGPLGEEESRTLFTQVVSGVAHMHSLNFSHRDLKLSNVLLTKTMQVKICDFGLARISYLNNRGIRFIDQWAGTEPYMAPEIIRIRVRGPGYLYNPLATDVWALGVIIYAMLHRSLPFMMRDVDDDDKVAKAKERERIYRRQRRMVYPVSSDLDDQVKDLIEQCLDPDPFKRITAKNILIHPWMTENKFVNLHTL